MRRFLVFLSIFSFWGNTKIAAQFIQQPKIGNNEMIFAADLDMDGDMDLINRHYIYPVGDRLEWHENDGTGNFIATRVFSSFTQRTRALDADDIDGDGDMDIIVGSIGSLVLSKNNGAGIFDSNIAIRDNYPESARNSIDIGDMDNDGDMDIISGIDHWYTWSDNNWSRLELYLNDGNDNFENTTELIYQSHGSFTTELGDLDNDGLLDIIVNNSYDISWLKNLGNGVFTDSKKISNETLYPLEIHVSDFNNDGYLDIASINDDGVTNTYGSVTWYENKGDGNFVFKLLSGQQVSNGDIFCADLDKNGFVDILTTVTNSQKIAWFKNEGNGLFSDEKILSIEDYDTHEVFVVDLDQDQYLDVVYSRDTTCEYFTSTYAKVFWLKNIFNYKQVSSFLYLDNNQNGLYEIDEKPLISQNSSLSPHSSNEYSNSDGYTHFYVENGEYQLTYEPNPLWELTTTPEIYHITKYPCLIIGTF